MTKKLFLFILISLAFNLQAAELTIDDYCVPSQNQPKAIKDVHPLRDGESYCAISDDGKSIDVFSYKTGEKKSSLFSIADIKGDIKIDNFEGYEISANEKKILLWNNSKKIYRRSFVADYFVYDILRQTLLPVSNDGPQRAATLSHDGRMVAYARDNNIYISNIEYKSDRRITKDGIPGKIVYGVPDWGYEEEFGIINTIRWNRDDNVLAFMKFDETEVPVYTFDEYGIYNPENPLGEKYPTSYSYKYSLAGYPNSNVEVYAYNLDNELIKKMDLPIEDGYVPSLEFDELGKNLMVMVLNHDQNVLQLFKVNPGSTVAHLLLTEKSDTWLSPAAYQMVKYYSDSFVIASDRSGFRHLYEYDYNGNLRKQLTKGEWYVSDYYGRNKSGIHFIQTTQNGPINRNVARVGSSGVTEMLNNEAGTETAYFSSNFDYYIRKFSTALLPTQYTICYSSGKLIKALELNQEYSAKYKDAPKKEFLKVKNSQGKEMDACITKPIDFDSTKKYPLLMYQYNGPESQLVLNEWKVEGTDYIATQGYIICTVDGRGTGYKNKEWSDCVYKHLGVYESEDQLFAADYFASLPYIDPTRTACFGWSYGGYMSLMELGAEDCKFKAGVSMAPVSDWRFYDSIYTERYMQTPQQNPEGFKQSAPLTRADNLKARLLIMSGTSDDNVHFYNTMRYTAKLNYLRKTYDMMVFPGYEHSLRKDNIRSQLFMKVVDFLNQNVKN